VSLSKVTLTKSAPSVSLTKQGSDAGSLRINLNWASAAEPAASRGFFKRLTGARQEIDLDLACLYEFTDGAKGVVQALGNSFTSRNPQLASEPIIVLDGDDRSGTNTEGENLYVNLAYRQLIRRILVFSYIYEGAPNWASANGVVTLFPHSGAPVEVRLDDPDPTARTCAVAILKTVGNEVTVQREIRYIHGMQAELDRAYGWGMKWTPGRK
jgi:tellurite resistance protein TerA